MSILLLSVEVWVSIKAAMQLQYSRMITKDACFLSNSLWKLFIVQYDIILGQLKK